VISLFERTERGGIGASSKNNLNNLGVELSF